LKRLIELLYTSNLPVETLRPRKQSSPILSSCDPFSVFVVSVAHLLYCSLGSIVEITGMVNQDRSISEVRFDCVMTT
jgi:hypothetical protein